MVVALVIRGMKKNTSHVQRRRPQRNQHQRAPEMDFCPQFPVNTTANHGRYIYIGNFTWRDFYHDDQYFPQTNEFLLSVAIDVKNDQTANTGRYKFIQDENKWFDTDKKGYIRNTPEFLCHIEFD